MFWRKKSDGFEWHKYVRTTIKLRREDRRRRLDDAKEAAVGGMKVAGKAGVAAGVSAAEAVNRSILAPVAWLGSAISAALGALAAALAHVLTPVARLLEQRGLAPALGLVAVLSGLLGLARAQAGGWDAIALGMALGSLALVAFLVVPPLMTGRGPAFLTTVAKRAEGLLQRIPGVSGLSIATQRALIAGCLVVIAAAGGWLAFGRTGALPGLSLASLPGLSRPPLEGTASVLSGDSLRVGGQSVRLSGIEAPELEQQCGGQGRNDRRWRCGQAAQTALQELVRGRNVRCDLGLSSERGLQLATCRTGDTDIAATLVSRGHVFSQQGMFASYGRQEEEARNAKLGIWRGPVERPGEYRARLWESAKKSSPDGCPIKGHVSGSAKLYVVPWSPSYAKTKVRQERGGRWFCSEEEALADGWRPGGRS